LKRHIQRKIAFFHTFILRRFFLHFILPLTKVIKVQCLCLIKQALRHEGGSGCGELGTSWGERWASRACRLLPGKESRYPLERGLGGPQNLSGRHAEVKLLELTGAPTSWSFSPEAVAIQIMLPRQNNKLLQYSLDDITQAWLMLWHIFTSQELWSQ
jgi:hypothetical protein